MGYTHNTHMSKIIPCTEMMPITGTWTEVAGQVAGTICKHKAAAAETAIVYIPITIPSNSVALQGSKLLSVEIDYEVLVAACTSVTAALTKVTRGADGSDAVVAAVTGTQNLTAATDAADVDEHKLTFTVTTPAFIDNDEYYILTLTCVAAATTQLDILAAVANYTARM